MSKDTPMLFVFSQYKNRVLCIKYLQDKIKKYEVQKINKSQQSIKFH